MKLTKQSILAASALLIGGFIGASALVALADSTWTSAPACTTMPCSNVSAPVNVSVTAQTKPGLLGLNTLMVKNLMIGTGTPVVGQVLGVQSIDASTGYANVNWISPTSNSSGVPSMMAITSTRTWVVPAGVTHIRVRGWGAGSGGGCGTQEGLNRAFGPGSKGADGGSGESLLTVTPGTTYSITIGSGGTKCTGLFGHNAGNGGATSFGPLLTFGGGTYTYAAISGSMVDVFTDGTSNATLSPLNYGSAGIGGKGADAATMPQGTGYDGYAGANGLIILEY